MAYLDPEDSKGAVVMTSVGVVARQPQFWLFPDLGRVKIKPYSFVRKTEK